MSKYGLIYKHVCLLATSTNGIYIGKTIASKNPNKRGRDGKGYLNDYQSITNRKIANAILKFGLENGNNESVGTHEIIEQGIPLEQLSDRERYGIAYFDSYANGLNSTTGGEGIYGRVYSEETLKKMKQTAKNRSKKLYQYNTNFVLISEYESIASAILQLQPTYKSAIKNCIDKPGRHGHNFIFMKEKLSAESLMALVTEHARIGSEHKALASTKSADKRKQTFRLNKQLAGYTKKTYLHDQVIAINILTNEQQVFQTKTACIKILQINKKALYKYLNTDKPYKNYLFISQPVQIPYKTVIGTKDTE